MMHDLTEGKPSRVLLRFCLPLFGSVVFQQLYNLADSLVAGRFVGENALAAVGNSYELTLLFLAVSFGCNIGCSVVTAQLFGAGRHDEMKTAIHTALIASGVICLLLTGGGLLLSGRLLTLIRTPAEIYADSKLYLDIYILGVPFLLLYNVATGIFSALGDSRTPFWFLAASSLSNIFMDIFFVTAFRMGVAGVAWATFLCQGASCVLAVWVVFRRLRGLAPEQKGRAFSWPMLGRLARVAVPSMLQQGCISVGNIIIQGVINGFGTAVVAGYAAAIKLNNLVTTSFTTLGNGMSNFTAQNLGAEKPQRIRKGFAAGLWMIWALCLPLMGLYYFAAAPLLRLFLKDGTALAMETGIQLLHILVPFYPVISVKFMADGVLRGGGLMGRFMVSTFTDLTLRVSLAVLLSASFGPRGIWSAWPIGWSTAAVLSLLFYLTGPWRRRGAVDKA